MSKKLLYSFFFLLAFLDIKSTTFADVLTCDIKTSCASSDVRMTYLSSTTNAHVEFAGGASVYPRSICCSSNGATVASTTLRIVETDKTGVTASSCAQVGGKALFTFPGVQPTVFVSNASFNTLKKITSAGVTTTFATTVSGPDAITIDRDGNLYTANTSSNNVYKITPAGVLSTFATTGASPYAITIDRDGNLYTANNASNTVSKITPAGVSSILGTTGTGPSGITIDPQGNIYTTNNASNTVSKITSAGVSSILGSAGTSPDGIVIDSIGNIYVGSRGGAGSFNITKITPGGVSSLYATMTQFGPSNITIDAADNIYAVTLNGGIVHKVTPGQVVSILGTTNTFPTDILLTPTNGSHIGTSTAYQREACLIATTTPWNITTAFQSSSCAGYGTTVLSMSQPGDNATVGASSTYNTKLCLTAWTNPSISFSLSDTAINFGTLSPASTRWATNTTGTSTEPTGTNRSLALTTTVSNVPGGFSLYMSGSNLTSSASSTITIAPMSTPGSLTTGIDQFGIQARVDNVASTIATTLDPNYGGSNYYYALSTSTLSLLTTSAGADGTLRLFLNLGANIAPSARDGSYTNSMTFVLVPNF